MSLDALVSGNTQKARASACNAFFRFIEADRMDEQLVHDCVVHDPTGARLVAIVGRFGLHLAFCEGKGGKQLATSSIVFYFGKIKN
jgi:hypothetical protein